MKRLGKLLTDLVQRDYDVVISKYTTAVSFILVDRNTADIVQRHSFSTSELAKQTSDDWLTVELNKAFGKLLTGDKT